MRLEVPGPAANLIDFGYAVKRPLCVMVDETLGIAESDPRSLTRFLDMCYMARRPGFVAIDVVHFTWIYIWSSVR